MSEEIRTKIEAYPIPNDIDLLEWLRKQSDDLEYLLAHTHSGIIWGRQDETGWVLSSDVLEDQPALEAASLQQLRLFNQNKEIFVWQDDTGLNGRQITDGVGDELNYMDESQILWGTYGKNLDKDFTLLEDGVQGLFHAVPINIPSANFGNNRRPARLVVRHYITRHKETGLGRISYSRLQAIEGGTNGS